MSLPKKIFKVIFPPFNFSSTLDALKSLANLLWALITGGTAIGYQEIDVDDVAAVSLTVPDGTLYATIICEADSSSADTTRSIRFFQIKGFPDPNGGLGAPLGDLGVVDIMGSENLKAFKAIGIEAGKTHKLRVTYYA